MTSDENVDDIPPSIVVDDEVEMPEEYSVRSLSSTDLTTDSNDSEAETCEVVQDEAYDEGYIRVSVSDPVLAPREESESDERPLEVSINDREDRDTGQEKELSTEDVKKIVISIHKDELLSTNEKIIAIEHVMTTRTPARLEKPSVVNEGVPFTMPLLTNSQEALGRCIHKEYFESGVHLHNDLTNDAEISIICERLSDGDLEISYSPKKKGVLGCEHYMRGCKVHASCCKKWYVCRMCHDDDNNHLMEPKHVEFIMCMVCKKVQRPDMCCKNLRVCASEVDPCCTRFGRYYCRVCKLWENDPKKRIYHCNKCNLCRVGDPERFFHCDKCGCCLIKELENKHRCIENTLECDCPICGEYMFTTRFPVTFTPCGHGIHTSCYHKYVNRAMYQCPVCRKSMYNVDKYFRRLDKLLADEQMPEEYKDTKALIFCSDCELRSTAPYHFLYHKCTSCGSYNTRVLDMIKPPEGTTQTGEGTEENTHENICANPSNSPLQ